MTEMTQKITKNRELSLAIHRTKMVRSEDSVVMVTFWTSAEAAQRMELRWQVTAPSEQSGPMIGRGQGYRKRLCTKGNGFCTKGNSGIDASCL